jgi:hypothetical protein
LRKIKRFPAKKRKFIASAKYTIPQAARGLDCSQWQAPGEGALMSVDSNKPLAGKFDCLKNNFSPAQKFHAINASTTFAGTTPVSR